ncbi:MAG: hypothetical protein RLY89_1432 [Bacteroidota bacterium]|jgi:IS4 transposase
MFVSNVDFDKSITGNIYTFDSTTIDLCFNVFWWAIFKRAKVNFSFVRLSAEKPDKAKGILCDQRVKMKGLSSIEKYEKVFSRVKFYDAEQKRSFVFLSNNLTLPSTEIALLYKNRWKIELFFKWIKQHLKIKSFWGVSENAVRTQIYIAIITYTLVSIIKAKLKLKQSP